MKSCFLFGHSDCPESILSKIEDAIEQVYLKYGVTDYYVGNRRLFDALAATAVKRMKQRFAEICLYLLIAYHPAERPVDLREGFDGSYFPHLENTPRQYAIAKANRHMVQTSDVIVCYVWHCGNTRALLEMAHKRKLPVLNLAEKR